MRVAFLASGSRGNVVAVCSGEDVVLVDVGLSARETRRRLAASQIDERRVRAILLTHEHSDHVAGVRVLAKQLDVPVLATEGTIEAAARHIESVATVERVAADREFTIGALRIRPFATSHDAAEPVGYAFEGSSGTLFGLASDTGHMPGAALEVLETCTMVGLESNHDIGMLQSGPYPYFLKERILSGTGHLSNDDAATVLEHLIERGVRSVCALHLSEQNNAPSIVRRVLAGRVARSGAEVSLSVASQNTVVICSA